MGLGSMRLGGVGWACGVGIWGKRQLVLFMLSLVTCTAVPSLDVLMKVNMWFSPRFSVPMSHPCSTATGGRVGWKSEANTVRSGMVYGVNLCFRKLDLASRRAMAAHLVFDSRDVDSVMVTTRSCQK